MVENIDSTAGAHVGCLKDSNLKVEIVMSGEILKRVRARISALGNSEFDAVSDQPALKELWEQVQSLREEMNEAKKAAAAAAAAPYLEAIGQIEKRYAMILKLSS
jgi:hypothetical protein